MSDETGLREDALAEAIFRVGVGLGPGEALPWAHEHQQEFAQWLRVDPTGLAIAREYDRIVTVWNERDEHSK